MHCCIHRSAAYTAVRYMQQCGVCSSAAHTTLLHTPHCGAHLQNNKHRYNPAVSGIKWQPPASWNMSTRGEIIWAERASYPPSDWLRGRPVLLVIGHFRGLQADFRDRGDIGNNIPRGSSVCRYKAQLGYAYITWYTLHIYINIYIASSKQVLTKLKRAICF